MPQGKGFVSKAQQRMMFSQHPEMAKKWAHETPDMKSLPEKVGDEKGDNGPPNKKAEDVKEAVKKVKGKKRGKGKKKADFAFLNNNITTSESYIYVPSRLLEGEKKDRAKRALIGAGVGAALPYGVVKAGHIPAGYFSKMYAEARGSNAHPTRRNALLRTARYRKLKTKRVLRKVGRNAPTIMKTAAAIGATLGARQGLRRKKKQPEYPIY